MFANPDWTEDTTTREFWRIDPLTGDRVVVYARECVEEYPWTIVVQRADGSTLLALAEFDSACSAQTGYDSDRKYLPWSETRPKILEWGKLKSGKGFGRDSLRFGFVAVQHLQGKGWYVSRAPNQLLHDAGGLLFSESETTAMAMVDILDYEREHSGLNFLPVG